MTEEALTPFTVSDAYR